MNAKLPLIVISAIVGGSNAYGGQEESRESTNPNPILYKEWVLTNSIEKVDKGNIETIPNDNDITYLTTLVLNEYKAFLDRGECSTYSGSLDEYHVCLQTEVSNDYEPSEWYWNFFDRLSTFRPKRTGSFDLDIT